MGKISKYQLKKYRLDFSATLIIMGIIDISPHKKRTKTPHELKYYSYRKVRKINEDSSFTAKRHFI